MIRNLTALALVLAAVSAIGAVSASAASASVGTLTSTGPFYLLGTGEEIEGTIFTSFFGESVPCFNSHYTGGKINTTEPIPNDSSTITVTPNYSLCLLHELPTTVTINGCDYVFHVGETTGAANTFEFIMDIECPGTQNEWEIYSSSGESLKLCSIKFGTQTGLSGATISEVGTNTLLVSGTISGVSVTKSGPCGSASTNEAAFDLNITLHGFQSNEESETTVAISHT